jgi:hypothetical protein
MAILPSAPTPIDHLHFPAAAQQPPARGTAIL